MTEIIIKSFSILSIFLLIGVILRARVKLFQNLYLPASVIGGFIGLIFSKDIIGHFSSFYISEDYNQIFSRLPGLLSIPIFAAIPLGMFLNEKIDIKKLYPFKVIMMFGIFQCAAMIQSATGYGVNLLFSKIDSNINIYRTFGYELSAGFSGGHGYAASIGKLLEGFNIPQWEIAQGISITTATIGLIGGLIFGIIFINIAVRNGKTNIIKENIDIELKKGFNKNIETQNSLGREIFYSNSIDTITIHLAIIFSVCGLSYIVLSIIKKLNIAGLNVLPVWTYSMIIMFLLNLIIKRLKLEWIIDIKVKSRIINMFTDFAIISAIISLPIKAISSYIIPIIVMCVLGFVFTYMIVFGLTRLLFKNDYSFERSIISWGTLTGVLITGVTLLKICDSDYKSPVLSEFSLAFSLMSVSGLLVVPILNTVLAIGSTFENFIVAIITAIVYLSISLIVFKIKS